MYEEAEIDSKKMSIMLFTSGTTDTSKIVMLSQDNIMGNIRAYPDHFKYKQTEVLLSALPIHHTFECSLTIIYGFYCGITVAFSDGLRYIADNLKEYGVTIFISVPLILENMYKKILKEIELQGKTEQVNRLVNLSNSLLKHHIDMRKIFFKRIADSLGGKIRLLVYGSAPMDPDIIEAFHNWGFKTMQGYGLTETCPVLTAETPEKTCNGSAGVPLSNVQVKIKNPDKDGIGDIVVKGPNVFIGYYEDKEKTEAAFDEEGWFKTGDIGYIDDKGFLFITGRQNDVIVLRNGKNVFPQELETLINRIPFVKESMVFARNNSKSDMLLAAKIVFDAAEMKKLYPDCGLEDYQKIIWDKIEQINKCLVSYKRIKQIIITSTELSKTTTQKVKRFEEINNTTDTEQNFILPENETEEVILKCIQDVLETPAIDMETDFFMAGGDSLLAIDLQMALSKHDIELNTQEIFDHPTAKKMYSYLIESRKPDDAEQYVPVDIKSKNIDIKNHLNVLLTGSTGYLGIHLLNELLTCTDSNVYCVVRQSSDTYAADRLRAKYAYYFKGSNFDDYIDKRLFVIPGDLSKEHLGIEDNTYNDLISCVDMVIHSAAAVTHYGDRKYSYKCNVLSTQNILKFAQQSSALVNHISTTSISGNNLINTNKCIKDIFSENDLIIGQKYNDNVYLSTKLEAESLVINAIKDGIINANIMRVGNLMNRYSDNLFQENKESNAFQNKMKQIIRTKCVPKNSDNFTFDLTPVDLCAEAVVKLAINESYNNVYHVLNNREIGFKDLIKLLKLIGMKVNITEAETCPKDEEALKWLLNDFLLNNKKKIVIDSAKTQSVLKNLGFEWNVDEKYYINVLRSILN